MRINIRATFAYNAIPLPEKKLITFPIRIARSQKAASARSWTRFSYVAESAVLNAALRDLDVEAAADTFVKNYDPTQSYKRGAYSSRMEILPSVRQTHVPSVYTFGD